MPQARMQAHARTLGALLARDSDAASMLTDASHRKALAECSTDAASVTQAAEQAARAGFEGLRNVLDPRRQRPVHFGLGLAVLAGGGAILAALDRIDLAGVPAGRLTDPLVLAATAVWLTGAWLAAIAGREKRRAFVAVLTGSAALLGLLFAALYDLGPARGWPIGWGGARVGDIAGVAVSLLRFGLVVAASMLIARMEPASILLARRRWRRAQARHRAASDQAHDDVEAAAVAIEAWLTIVRIRATAIAAGDERLIKECMALAAVLVARQAAGACSLPQRARSAEDH